MIRKFCTPVDLAQESIGNYYMNIYKNGEFVEGRHYEGYSGNAMMEEVKYLKNHVFKIVDGYSIQW